MSEDDLEKAEASNGEAGIHIDRYRANTGRLFGYRRPTGPENHLLSAIESYQACVCVLLDHIRWLDTVRRAAQRYSEWEFNDFAYNGHIPEGLLNDRRALRDALLGAGGRSEEGS